MIGPLKPSESPVNTNSGEEAIGMKKRILSILLALVMLVCLLPMTALAGTEVDAFNLVVRDPETGYTPVEAYSAPDEYSYSVSWSSLHVSSAATSWTYLDEYNLEQVIAYPETFKPETVYTIHVTLQLSYGYEFADPPQITINGTAAELEVWSTYDPTYVVLKRTFAPTAPLSPIEKVSVTATEPLCGANINETVECDYIEPYVVDTAEWYNSAFLLQTSIDTYTAGETYTLVVNLKAKDYAKFPTDLKAEDCVLNPDWFGDGLHPSGVYVYSDASLRLEFEWTIPVPISSFQLFANEQAYGENPAIYAWAETGAGYEVRATRYYDELYGNYLEYWDVLEDGHSYRMEMDVYPTKGNTFTSTVTATLNGTPCTYYQNYLTFFTVYAPAPLKMAETIMEAEVSYTEPVEVGGYASDAALAPVGQHYDVAYAVWYDDTDTDIYGFYFEEGRDYTFRITLEPDMGYAFDSATVFRYNGGVVEVTEDGRYRTISIPFHPSSWSPVVTTEGVFDLGVGAGIGDFTAEKDTLKALAAAGYITVREEGTALYCDLDKDGAEDICVGPTEGDPSMDTIHLLDTRSTKGEKAFSLDPTALDYLKAKLAPAYYENLKFIFPPLVWNITFDPDGGSGAMADDTVVRGMGYTLPGCSFTPPEGKVFDTWDLGAPGDTVSIGADMTIKAMWKDKPTEYWTVTFDANGGSGTMAAIKVEKGEEYTLPECAFTAPEGKKFEQWSYGAPGTVITVVDNMTITAYWEDKEETLVNPFVDVFEDDYYYDAVLWAYYAEPQVTNGIDATHFGPANTVTRGQAVTFLWRAMGCPEPTSTDNPFEDVTVGKYYYMAVLWAVEKGITNGTDATHFTPNQTCSTAHIITFLYRTMGIGDNGWYQIAEAWAKGAGLLDGLDITVAPKVDCPRCDVVLFLFRQLAE